MNKERYEWTGETFYVKKDDDRYEKFAKEKKETGISPDETWSLYSNIAIFVLPRLKLFKEMQKNIGGHPSCFRSNKSWMKILDKMIWSMEQIVEEKKPDDMEWDEYEKKVSYGITLFGKYFRCLWW